MKFNDLVVDILAQEVGSKTRALELSKEIIDGIVNGLLADGEVSFSKAGALKVHTTKAREYYVPNKGKVQVDSAKTVRFSVFKHLKERLND